jgi:hypothetical protein
MKLAINERDTGRLAAVAKYRGMTSEECALGLVQQELKRWEKKISEQQAREKQAPPRKSVGHLSTLDWGIS